MSSRRSDAPAEELGLGLKPGAAHYRAYVGPPRDYDLIAAMTFGLLSSLGLRQHHELLDIGCGSLRIGRLLIPYLNRGRYVGLEPNRWLVDEGIQRELGADILIIKQPEFVYHDSADSLVGRRFFDFVLAQSIFSHCGANLLERWLAQTATVLKPTGALVATFVMRDADETRQGWIYPESVAYRLESMQARARRHGFDFRLLDWRHPRQSWALFSRPEFDISWF